MRFKVGDKVRAMWNGGRGKIVEAEEFYRVVMADGSRVRGVFPEEIELLCSRCEKNPVLDDEMGERLGLCPSCANEEETLKEVPGAV